MDREIQEKTVKLFWKYYNDSNNNVEIGRTYIKIYEGKTYLCEFEGRDYINFREGFSTFIDNDLAKDFLDIIEKYRVDREFREKKEQLEFLNTKLGNEA